MIKGYNDFINENNDPNYIEDLYKMLVRYIVSELNKGTEFIGADPIKETDIQFDKDKTDIGEEWYYCTIQSIRLSSEPIDEPVDDHIEMMLESISGFKAIESIIEEIEEKFSIIIFNQIKNGGTKDTIEILTNIELAYIMNNEKLENFLDSIKGIDKFGL